MAVFSGRVNGARGRVRGHRTPDRLSLLLVLGVLVVAACTDRSGAGAGSGISPAPTPTNAARSSDIVAPTPTSPARSRREACRGGAIPGSKGMLSCGGNVGFRGLSPAYSVAIQADGRIVAVGGTGMYTGGGYDNNFAVARYNRDGTADSTFGDAGRVAFQLEPFQEAHGVAVQNDGGIVVAGSPSYGGPGTVSLARYTSDGKPDATFDKDGWVVAPWVGRANSVALQCDGAIVVVGERRSVGRLPGKGRGVALARFAADGTLDPTFGTGGLVTTSLGPGPGIGNAVAIQPDGRIVVAGRAGGALLLARYEPDGSLDHSFGTEGFVTRDFSAGPDIAYALAIQPGGRIVVAGRAADAVLLTRFEPNGSPDMRFGRAGGTITEVSRDDDVGRGVAVRDGGEIVVVGGVGDRSAVLLYRDDGTLDPSFGRRGLARALFGEKGGIAYAVATGSGKSIFVAGLIEEPFDFDGGSFGLTRYRSD
jgi:uncharacterized delta-60 repeat protein